MAKRLSDTEIWKKKWFRELPPKYKCFIKYLLDSCNLVGVWEVDFDLAQFSIGEKIEVDEVKKILGEKIIEFENGTKWLYKHFVFFQYGFEFNPKSPIHKKVADMILQYPVFKSSNTLLDTLWYRVYDTLSVAHDNPIDIFSPNGISISDQFEAYWREKWGDDAYVSEFSKRFGLSVSVVKNKMDDFRNYLIGLEDITKIPRTEKGIKARFTGYVKKFIEIEGKNGT